MNREVAAEAAHEFEKEMDRLRQEAEVVAAFSPTAVDLGPLSNGEATAQRPNRKQRRRAMTKRQRRLSGVTAELRLAREVLRRAGQAPLMVTVRSRNGD